MEVYKAIAKVSAALASQGIGKGQRNEKQNYKFRGIDTILNALAPVLVENELIIIPRVVSSEKSERTTEKGGVLIYTNLTIEFDLISSKDGSKHTAVIQGEAMDSGDKSTNKAMSIAYKYLAILTFCIPTEGDGDGEKDPDFHSYEVAPKTVAPKTVVKPAAIKSANPAASNEPPAGWKASYR